MELFDFDLNEGITHTTNESDESTYEENHQRFQLHTESISEDNESTICKTKASVVNSATCTCKDEEIARRLQLQWNKESEFASTSKSLDSENSKIIANAN